MMQFFPAARVLAERLEPRTLLASAGRLLQYDFNSGTAWPAATAIGSGGVTAATAQSAVGTIDTELGTTPTGGMNLTAATVPSGNTWTADFSSGSLALTNTETNLGKLTLSFNLSASQVKPVHVRVKSLSAAGVVTGTLETVIYPVVADSFQRYALDLSTMAATGDGIFNAMGPKVSFEFGMVAADGWSSTATRAVRVDNVNFSKPAYYVKPATSGGSNSADGSSEATAFATPAKAVSVAQAGDIIDVMGGTYTISYTGTNAIDFSTGGAPAAWITLKNYPGQSPQINNEFWNAINVGNGTNAAHATTPAVAYIEVRGLHVRGNADYANTSYPSLLGATDPRTNNNGISVDGRYETNHPHDIRFADNFVEYCSAGGIGALEADRIQIENNVVQNTSWWTKYATSGISVLSAYSFDGTSNTYTRVIRNNVSSGNQTFVKWAANNKYSDGNGIIIDYNHNTTDVPDGVVVNRTMVTNNVSFNNGGSGIHSYKSNHVDIVNNTAYLNSASPDLQYGEIFANSADDVRIYNNVLVAPVADTANGAAAEPVNNSYNSTNVVYKDNVYSGGNIAPTVGSGDVIADPKFVSPSTDPATANFRLQSTSPAVNLGTASLAPVLDVADAKRYGNPDAGAYEYVPPAPASLTLAPASDTGTVGDNKTRFNNGSSTTKLSFVVGGTVSGAAVQLFTGTTLLGTATAAGTTTTVTTNGTAALPDGAAAVTAVQTFAGVPSAVSAPLAVTIDTARPYVVGTAVINAGLSLGASRSMIRTIAWTFSEPLLIGLGDLVLTNLATGLPVSVASRGFSVSGNVVTLTLDTPGVDPSPNLFLANGNYQLSVSPTVTDVAGNALDANNDGIPGETPTFAFFKLLGDIDGDRDVDFNDFLTLQNAYNSIAGGATYDAAADLNADGRVDFNDFLILQTAYNTTI